MLEQRLPALDGPFGGFNDGKLERLLIGDSLGSHHSKVIGSGEGMKLGLFYVEVLGNILINV